MNYKAELETVECAKLLQDTWPVEVKLSLEVLKLRLSLSL